MKPHLILRASQEVRDSPEPVNAESASPFDETLVQPVGGCQSHWICLNSKCNLGMQGQINWWELSIFSKVWSSDTYIIPDTSSYL